jgi:hypothetical protein
MRGKKLVTTITYSDAASFYYEKPNVETFFGVFYSFDSLWGSIKNEKAIV